MSVSGWVAIGCWAVVVALFLVGWQVGRRRERRKPVSPPVPPRLDFREWLDDWDEWL